MMWATVRPLTNITKLGSKVASTVVLEHDSPSFQRDAYEIFMTEISGVVSSIMKDIVTTRQLHYEVKYIAYAWFKYVTCDIIRNATSSPMFVNNHGVHSTISRADIVWSINNLSSSTWLQALGYSFQEFNIIHEQLRSEYSGKSNIKKILSPYLLELGERSVKKFSKKCWRSYTKKKCLESCAMSCEGVLVLLNWIWKILSLTMNKADSRYLENKGNRILSGEDMMWAFNWMRLNQLSSISLPLVDVQEPSNACNGQGLDANKKIRKRKRKPLPCLPHDLLHFHVLPKLSYGSLLRLKCVCKNWKATICSTHFQCLLREQEDHQIQSFGIFGNHGLKSDVFKKCDGLEFVAVDTPHLIDVYYSLDDSYGGFYAACSGFLCLTYDAGSSFKFIIGNPLTGEWNTIIPPILPSNSEICFHGPGLAVDLSNNPPWYKLVILVSGDKQHLFYVFSSETGEWEASDAMLPQFKAGKDDEMLIEREGNSVYINGLLHWMSVGRKLYWLDLVRDVAGSIALPCLSNSFGLPAIGSLERAGGVQRLTCSFYVYREGVETYGLVGENQWEKLLSISVRRYAHIELFPYMGGVRQLAQKNRRLVAYNIHTGKYRFVAKDQYDKLRFGLFPFKMNISPLPDKPKRVLLNGGEDN